MRLINQVLNWWKAAVFLPMVVISVTLSEYGRCICGAGGHHLATVEDVQCEIVEKMQTELEHLSKSLFLTSNLLKLHAFHFPKTFYLNNCNHKVFYYKIALRGFTI